MADINADLDAALAIVQGLPAKIEAAKAQAVADAEASTGGKAEAILSALQSIDASLTNTAAPAPSQDPAAQLNL